MHEHSDCKHELKHCQKCEVVFCDLCKVEWARKYPTLQFYGGSTSIPCVANTTISNMPVHTVHT